MQKHQLIGKVVTGRKTPNGRLYIGKVLSVNMKNEDIRILDGFNKKHTLVGISVRCPW